MDFTHILKQAEDTIKQRGQIYCSYSKHVEIYSQIVKQIKQDLLQERESMQNKTVTNKSTTDTSMQDLSMIEHIT